MTSPREGRRDETLKLSGMSEAAHDPQIKNMTFWINSLTQSFELHQGGNGTNVGSIRKYVTGVREGSQRRDSPKYEG